MSGGLEGARAAAGRGQERHSSSLPSRLRKYYKRQMDQFSGRSFMQMLCEKHNPENVPYPSGPGMGVNVPSRLYLRALLWKTASACSGYRCRVAVAQPVQEMKKACHPLCSCTQARSYGQ